MIKIRFMTNKIKEIIKYCGSVLSSICKANKEPNKFKI